MEPTQKSYTGPVIGIIVAVLIIGGGAWYFLQTRPVAPPLQPTPQPSIQQPPPTVQWKIFESEKYGFKVEYPPTLKVNEGKPAGVTAFDFANTESGDRVVFSVYVFPKNLKASDCCGSDWKPAGETTIDGIATQKLIRGEETAYIVSTKNVAIIFNGTNFHNITQSDLDKILGSFDFAATPSTVANITIQNFAFSPKELRIKAGTKVIWTNKDTAGHTVTSDTGTELNSAPLGQGKNYEHTFSQKGTFKYHCTPHPNMKATVMVE